MSGVRTVTRVEVTVDCPGSAYGPDWNLGDIIKQATAEVPNGLANKLGPQYRIVGTPKVKVITMIEE